MDRRRIWTEGVFGQKAYLDRRRIWTEGVFGQKGLAIEGRHRVFLETGLLMIDANRNSAATQSALRDLLADFSVDETSTASVLAQKAVFLTRYLQRRATELQTPQERRQQAELDRMMQNPGDKVTLMQMTDQAFRSERPRRAVDQLVHILDVQGIPRFFTPVDRMLLKGFQSFGSYLPGVSVPLVKEKMQEETANVILPAEEELLTQHLSDRRDEGVRMNVNYLGEALLGEDDARGRLKKYLQALQLPEIEVMSVKISTIYSQISTLAREQTLHKLCDRLELLYRAAAKSTFTRRDGAVVPKFVYLDMEEYRDMWLTADAFMRTLERKGLENVAAGIALQAYVPDSFLVQQQITEWASERVSQGGAPVTIRVVKGANMEMERFEAALNGWPQAPFKSKLHTDANYKRMVNYGMHPDHLKAVRLGIASHNLFELAYALVVALENDVFGSIQFEMLEGMANHQRRALFENTKNVLLYAPACSQTDFIQAIGYLVRRLDENTGPDNFLKHAFSLQVDSPDWKRLEKQFYDAFDLIDELSAAPRRTQDRHLAPHSTMTLQTPWQQFVNEPPTDFSLPANVKWVQSLVTDWRERCNANAMIVPLVIDGYDAEELVPDREVRESIDPSQPGTTVARYNIGTTDDVQQAVACAVRDPDGWRDKSPTQRTAILSRAAQQMRESWAELMGAAMVEGGKLITESDPEICEAIDFAEFYSRTAEQISSLPGLTAMGRGVVAVASPWNFPIAIPCGGVAAGLAAGNTVILKPASDTVLVAYLLCQCFWRAGVSRRALQFLPGPGEAVGQALVTHEDVDTVILTGGTQTALAMLKAKPSMRLLAETGGKNATIVTSMADRDQAIKNVLHSAFGHSGQKCSATSLLILEDEIYHDERFRETFCDAAKSLTVGPAWDLETKIGPLIRPPRGELETAVKELEPGEEWAVMPEQDDDNPHLVSPAIKWNVQPGSFTHMTEFFGPVLGVMRARDLYDAIDLVNQTGYGLTSGLESLDDREHEIWRDEIRAGNLYLNRGTTGAIVLRQPFGGMGKSAFGPGIKAGGPSYVIPLMRFEENDSVVPDREVNDPQLRAFIDALANDAGGDVPLISPDEVAKLIAAVADYEQAQRTEFGVEHDHFDLIGQDNLRRYLPVREMRIRVSDQDSAWEILARVSAAKIAGCRTTLSFPVGYEPQFISLLDELTHEWAGTLELLEESDESLASAIQDGHTHCVRYAAADRVPELVRVGAAETGVYIVDEPVLCCGRIELLWYVEEQSICNNYHRYGNLGGRATETRSATI